jgi:amidohydrolase
MAKPVAALNQQTTPIRENHIPMPTNALDSVAASAFAIQDWIVARRRMIHENPELAFHEEKTSALVEKELRSLGYQNITTRLNGNWGLCAELLGRDRERCIALRADMDALPIQEEWDLPFRSKNPGVAHLCGHDAHTSMLLGAARILKEREAELPCTVRLFFQGAEECIPGGARDFVEAGMLEGVDEIYGLHVDPLEDTGTLHTCVGPMMAGVGNFNITLRGRGGHAAAPHMSNDVVLAASHVVVALQQIISRRLRPTIPGVVSVTRINGGTASNVIPEVVTLEGTYRSYDADMHTFYPDAIREIATLTAQAFGCTAEVAITEGYPVLVNHADAVKRMWAVGREVMNGEMHEAEPRMGAEDFAVYGGIVPACFAYLGVAHPADNERFNVHHPRFHLDEDALWRGSAVLATLALSA